MKEIYLFTINFKGNIVVSKSERWDNKIEFVEEIKPEDNMTLFYMVSALNSSASLEQTKLFEKLSEICEEFYEESRKTS